MNKLVAGDLTIDAQQPDPAAPFALFWHGKSNDRQPGKLIGPFLESMMDRASERQVPVELHFETIEYLNSSTITAIIQTIQEARSRGVKLVLTFDQARKWQKLSFDALRVFVKDDGLFELRPT